MSDSGRANLDLVRRHLRAGWWLLLIFLTLGLVLEGMHAFKVGAYLNVKSGTRRLMWTLAHAHGTLFGLIHLAFAYTLGQVPDWGAKSRRFASNCLLAAALLMPAGFFLGGIWTEGGDPGSAILLVPAGGVLLFLGVLLCVRALHSSPVGNGGSSPRGKR